MEFLLLTLHLDHDQRLVAGAGDTLEGPQLDVGLHDRVLELAADQALGIEDSVFRVACNLVLCGIADQALGVREGHVGRGGPVALIVCDDLDAVVLPHADTAVRGAKIDTDCGLLGHGA
mmetsp:Transcript_122405/g.172264  ORF Transcript_122405/g.172264 Transcript_122405/m.172264 type:complete len:119 (-) Transcript_122405:72-428(-)